MRRSSAQTQEAEHQGYTFAGDLFRLGWCSWAQGESILPSGPLSSPAVLGEPGADRELLAAMRARLGDDRVLFSRDGFNRVIYLRVDRNADKPEIRVRAAHYQKFEFCRPCSIQSEGLQWHLSLDDEPAFSE
jgi:hypothetical protein